MNPILFTDGYKTSHRQQYPEGTQVVYSNFTPRSMKWAPKGVEKIVVFGTQMVVKQIHEMFKFNFFDKPKSEVIDEIKQELSIYLNQDYDVSHFEALHDLGYLPIKVQALREGSLIGEKIPVLTIYNTKPEFFWVTNYLETLISNLLWKPMTSATIAYAYKTLLLGWANATDKENISFVNWQGHDFSMRGMDSIAATISSGLGHLTSFSGTDSIPAILGAKKYYGETGFVAGSVPATEHAVMCAGGAVSDELSTFERLLDIYPTGIVSVVSDTWDLWKVCTKYLPKLKNRILTRDGKLVIRPDSGNPADILCGIKLSIYDSIEEAKESFKDNLWNAKVHGQPQVTIPLERIVRICNDYIDQTYKLKAKIDWSRYDKQYYFIEEIEVEDELYTLTAAGKGVIELLWDVFGGTVNEQGYKVLDPHIGAIYGDSITLDIAQDICIRLSNKGFASTNVVFGIGSFTYQYNTRDTLGFAMKATWALVKGIGYDLFKDPVTDSGVKKSAKGVMRVDYNEELGVYVLTDQLENFEDQFGSELIQIYTNGKFMNEITLTEIRNKLIWEK